MMDGRIHRGDCFALRFTSDFAFHCISLSSTEYLRALILVLNCIQWLHLDAGLSLSSKAWIAPASRASVNVYGTRY